MTNRVLGLLQVTFAGVNFDPVEGSTVIKLGGPYVNEGHMTDSGRFFGSTKIAGAEVEFEASIVEGFDPLEFQSFTGDVTIIADTGQAYLITNGLMASTPEIKAGEGKAKFMIKGDPAQLVS